jgi:HSP90 family molecular chaperone
MPNPTQITEQAEQIPFQLHPRVFAALGSDLVTNDIVAIIELVKNSYDAFATRVDVLIGQVAGSKKLRIEIQDNGMGMTRTIIEDVWCVVATPYRANKHFVKQGDKVRRVSGEKGLGRLAAARLGARLELITRAAGAPCWQVGLSWNALAKAKNVSMCNVNIQRCDSNDVGDNGTLIRILDLHSDWSDKKKTEELHEELSRLVSPFEQIEDFEIWLSVFGENEAKPLKIEPSEFLSKPPYLIKCQGPRHR